MLADYHVHSQFSNDCLCPMEEAVLRAIELGFEELCFTEHVDHGIKRDWDDPRGIEYCPGGPGEPERIPLSNPDYPRYFAELDRMRQDYGHRITLKRGLEFGVQSHRLAFYEDLFRRYPLDFVLLSVHQIGDLELWNGQYQQGKTRKQAVFGYYEELLTLVRSFHHYSVLAHADLITRYDPEGAYPFEELRPILTDILKQVISDGKGIEVNTSSRRYGLSDLTPGREILKLYRQLGGQVLTIGSDSHKTAHLGAGFRETKEALRCMGFQNQCTFVNMEPVWHPL